MRLTKAQLDGACADKRFPDNFFLDLIFEPCDAEMASKHLSGKADAAASAEEAMNDVESQNEAEERRLRGTMAGAENAPGTPAKPKANEGQGATVTASAYDSMLHRDSRFWDVIAARRQEHAHQTQEEMDAVDPYWGATIGRRRQFDNKPKNEAGETDASVEPTKATTAASAFSSFSIGGEFDFMASDDEPTTPKQEAEPPMPDKRDELMDALNAIDDDEAISPIAAKKTKPIATEEVLFVSPSETPQESTGTELFKGDEPAKVVSAASPQPAAKSEDSAVNEAAALLEEADLDLDGDVDAFLESAGVGGDDDDDIGDTDFGDLDFDDDELDDLENFLTSK